MSHEHAAEGARAEQAERNATARSGGGPIPGGAYAALLLQRAAGNRAVASALSVQRDLPPSLRMRHPPDRPTRLQSLLPDDATMRQMLERIDASRPQLRFDVFSRGQNPRLYRGLVGTAGHPRETRPATGDAGQAGGGESMSDPRRPHIEVHPQLQAGTAWTAQFNDAAVGPGAGATRAAAPGTQVTPQTQVVAGVVVQFHDDAQWGWELTPFQGQVNLDAQGHMTGWQGNVQLSFASPTLDTVLRGEDGQRWKAQLQLFGQASGGEYYDPPDPSGARQTHPAGSLQGGAQVALTHGPVQFWVQVAGGGSATTSPGADSRFVLTPVLGGAVGVTIQF